MQIIDSLEHCSTRNVFHRDVKLENILVVPTTLQITLIDFGCGSFYKDTSFTDFAGTPQYYPPEWFLNRKYNGYRQTIWSCGVLLYSLITGTFILPFESGRYKIADDNLAGYQSKKLIVLKMIDAAEVNGLGSN